MEQPAIHRRLAAILAADVEGYSRLMAADEEGTLAALHACRVIIDQHIAAREGRIVGSAGDSVLAEFASPVEAVRCAVAIQDDLKERNAPLPEWRRMEFRIGINLGDVIAEGSGIYGDGVNVAARLEGLAEAGGICISGTTYDHVRGKLPYRFPSEGQRRVKNIPGKVRTYSVHPAAAAAGIRRRLGIVGASVGALASVAAAGAFLGRDLWQGEPQIVPAAVQSATPVRIMRDCAGCPELVEIPSGRFVMGSPAGEQGRDATEGPLHEVAITKPFALGRYEVTFAEWDACVDDGGCTTRPNDRDWGRATRPVIYVGFNDVQEYLAWLGRKSGLAYRLPSEAEWEHAARAGSTTRFWWGDEVEPDRANCARCGAFPSDTTLPVGSYPPNSFGLFDMHGNVWEWTADCWNGSYAGAPGDGSPRLAGDCTKRVLRGGAWGLAAEDGRSARRIADDVDLRSGKRGFRIARNMAEEARPTP